MVLSIFHSLPSNVLIDLAVIIILSTVLAMIAKFVKQPLIPAYIFAGVILGPIGLGFIQDVELIRALSEIGIAFLLFVVGLEVNINKLKEVGWLASITGIIQTALVFFAGYYLGTFLGYTNIVSTYFGLILAFSSTMVVIKLLGDGKEIDTLHGRIIIGILLVQDFLAMIAIASLTNLEMGFQFEVASLIIVKSMLLISIAFITARYVYPKLFGFAARSKELLFLLSVTSCFIFAILAVLLDFSVAIGTFISGISLAALPYTTDIRSKVEPLKDFFATIFFVSLGAQLIFTGVVGLVEPLLLFTLIVIFIKPLVIFLAVTIAGYSSDISFMSGISLAQVSEFSLIIVSQGYILGHLPNEILTLTVIIAIITIVLTSYFMKHAKKMQIAISRFLKLFEILAIREKKLGYTTRGDKKSIGIFGCNRMGTLFIETFRSMDKRVIVVDNDPDLIKKLMVAKISCKYGDVTSREVLDSLNLEKIKMIVSSIPKFETNLFILDYVKSINPKITIILTTEHVSEAFQLYNYGADFVIIPHVISGEKVSEVLKQTMGRKKEIVKYKKNQIKLLESLESLGLN